jgi:acylphosphatase
LGLKPQTKALEPVIRLTLHYTGRVQGVGFRAACRDLARDYAASGYVMNLPDGRVLLEAEGEPEQLEALAAAIAQRMNRYIKAVQSVQSPATGQFGQPAPGALSIRR